MAQINGGPDFRPIQGLSYLLQLFSCPNQAEGSPGDDKKNVYRRTFKEDRPRLVEVFLAIIEWFSFAEIYKFYNLKKSL
ncbi:hypothetical protein J21TS7_25840 [Paenibacillus cineris]|uniref:Transposase n=1 Tax=Paenibacillus cineris TaxID=237530 RepID=A0ABQ4LCG8_9BACL|nr:hypothetical protein J21TS7_25840 [Paenibacillus cineris]